MPKADDEQFVNFYYFWKWEYTRRNEQYKNKIQRVLSGEFNMEEIFENEISWHSKDEYQVSVGDFMLLFPNNFKSEQFKGDNADEEVMSFTFNIPNPLPTIESAVDNHDNNTNNFIYSSSEEIIVHTLRNDLEYKFPDLILDRRLLKSMKYIDKEVYTIIPHKVLDDYTNGVCPLPFTGKIIDESWHSYMIERAKKEREAISIKQSEEVFIIDLDCDIETAVNELYFFLNLRRGKRDYKMTRDHILKKGTTRRKSRDLPRAIGLWLWDYIEQHKISWNHRAKSYKAFDSIFHNPNRQDMYIDAYFTIQKLASLLDITNNCVQSMDVFPMG